MVVAQTTHLSVSLQNDVAARASRYRNVKYEAGLFSIKICKIHVCMGAMNLLPWSGASLRTTTVLAMEGSLNFNRLPTNSVISSSFP